MPRDTAINQNTSSGIYINKSKLMTITLQKNKTSFIWMSIMYIVKSVCATEMVVYIFNHFKRVNEKEIQIIIS